MKTEAFWVYWQRFRQQMGNVFAPAIGLWQRAPYVFGGSILLFLLSLWLLWYLVWRRPFDAWFLMPEQPVLVIEGKNFRENYLNLRQNQIWKDLQKTNYAQSISQKIEFIEQLRSQAPSDSLAQDFFISLHITSKNSFDALFYVPMPQEAQQAYFQKILRQLAAQADFRFTSRNLRGINLQEVRHRQQPKLSFTFLVYKNIFVGSYSPLLVEDVVRKISEGASPIRLDKPQTLNLGKKNADFLLYLNPSQLPRLIQQASQEALAPLIEQWGSYAERGFFELVFSPKSIALEGFSLSTSPDSSQFVELFERQKPQAFSLGKVLPRSTAFFYHYTFSDNQLFFSRLASYQNEEVQNMRLFLQQRYQFSFTEFMQGIQQEFALAYQESREEEAPLLIYLKCQNAQKSRKQLDRLAKALARKQNLDFYEVKAGAYRISELRLADFSNLFSLGQLLKTRQSYYTVIANCLVISNDLGSLRQATEQYQAQEVLKNLGANVFGGEHYNFRFWLSPDNAWKTVYQNASLPARFLLQQSSSLRRRLKALSFVLKEEEQGFYTRLALQSAGSSQQDKPQKTGEVKQIFSTRLSNPAFTRPYLVKNHNNQEWEILLQDIDTQLYLFSQSGKLHWQRRLNIPMRSQPLQVDIYQNDKLQYLFYSNHRLQLKDRLGRHVSGFPIFTGDTTRFNAFAHIAPSASPNKFYFLMANERGRVFILDNERKWQAAWKPKRLEYRLGTNPQYFELQQQGYLSLLQADGKLNVFDLAGEQYPNFPLSLEGRFSNPLGLILGSSRRNSFLTALSDEGRVFNLTLSGQLISQEQLYRPSSKAKFWLCQAEPQQDNWLIAVSDKGYLGVFDREGNLLFEKNYENGSDKAEVQFFSFNVDKQFIAFTDKIRGKTYIYNLQGKEILPPFTSNKGVAMMYDGVLQELSIYFVSGNILGLNSIYLP